MACMVLSPQCSCCRGATFAPVHLLGTALVAVLLLLKDGKSASACGAFACSKFPYTHYTSYKCVGMQTYAIGSW